MQFQEDFCLEIETVMKYTVTLRDLVSALQAVNIVRRDSESVILKWYLQSGDSYEVDQEKQSPVSGWKYVQRFMKGVNILGKKNKAEVEKLYALFEKIGSAEEDIYR